MTSKAAGRSPTGATRHPPRPIPTLSIDDVVKDYRGGVRANNHISLEVAAGEIVGLLGHNGAGKTTLLNQIVGIAAPTSGRILVEGRDAVADPAMARRVCSMQPQAQAPLAGVTPRESIELMARIRGASRPAARRRTNELIDGLDMGTWATTTGERLSGGMQRLTSFAMAVAQPGRLVMLDEPTNDVDPVRRRLLWQEIRRLADSGCAIILVTHNVLEAERAVDRVAILDCGRVVIQGSPTALRGVHAGRLRMEVGAVDNDTARSVAEGIDPAQGPVVVGRRVIASIAMAEASGALRWVQGEQTAGRVDEFSLTPVSLEDIYVRLVGATSNARED